MAAKRVILIVEDEPSIAENVIYALQTEGFDPVWVTTGHEALSIVGSKDVALAILDVGLPDTDGFELAKRIRGQSKLPIIFLTARSSEIDRVVGLELGADDYVVKPFSVRELSARVKAVLRRGGQAPEPPPHSNNPFQIDERRCAVIFRGALLPLSRYEYRLMRILVRSPGRVYSREQLMQLAWEEPDMSLERTVDTHIKTIRQKLKAAGAEVDPIITHRGLGYSLREE
ncbi:MAG: two-component system response regulator CreB [Deltaproteobacteria bacterium]|nr:two-component system response regulator CreB [Deltaproteobacteria bacterium]